MLIGIEVDRKMERIMEDAMNVKNLLPWIDSDEDIINFMRKIPLDKSHLRIHLTLRYFLNKRDCHSNDFAEKIENDAREIVILMPEISYRDIKEKLIILGDIPNRKEVVIRELLHKKHGLDTVLTEINDYSAVKKRKTDSSSDDFGLDSDEGHTDKRYVVDCSLKVPRISNQDKPSTKVTPNEEIEEPTTSSTSVTSSTSISSNSTPDSTVRSTTTGTDDPDLDLATALDVNPRTDNFNLPTNMMPSTSQNKATEEKFNLIDFVKELSLAPDLRIFQLCKQLKLDLNKKPSEEQLNQLLNQLLDDDVVEIRSAESSDSDDAADNMVTRSGKSLPSSTGAIKKIKTDKKRFKLKEPVLTLQQERPPQELPVTRPGPSVIQPARFNPAPREDNFPAVVDAILNYSKKRALPNEDNVEALPIFDEEPSAQINPLPRPLELTRETMIIDEPDETGGNDGDGLAAGPSNVEVKEMVLDQNLVLRMIEMFPQACPNYIRTVCNGKQWKDLDDIVTVVLLAPDYPKRPERQPSPPKEVDPEEQFQIIKELLPDADPTYLQMQWEQFGHNEKAMKEFINDAMEKKNYPTMKEYLRKQQLSAQQRQYTTEFNVVNFVQLFPEPEKTFSDTKRTVKMGPYSVHYLTTFFKNRHDKIHARTIQQVLIKKNFKVLLCEEEFVEMKKNAAMKSRRKHTPLNDNLENIPLLQELAYLTHKEEITEYLQQKQKREEEDRLQAKELGLMETCQCCYDDEVMPKDTFNCPNGCKFCRECIKRSCEVALGDGKTDFPCLAACPEEFTLQTLQSVLPPKMFSKLAQKKALAEIKAAGIEELEMCPFCDFATIPNEADKIFRCLNPDCMKESCRTCKEPNHLPLKCEEVEKDQDVKARTYIENKMTEALLRKCWKCGTSFFKEEGCNKMTCSCGASMCYICQEPVTDYAHFNGIGGDKHELCPLYSDTVQVNQQNVLGAAAAAKAEIDPTNLKTDPTVGITDHFEDRAKKLPREPHLELLHRVQQHVIRPVGHHHHGHHRPRHRHHVVQAQQRREQLEFVLNMWRARQ